MAHVMIIGTNIMSIYNHRLELIKRLLELNYNVTVVTPSGSEQSNLENLGVNCINISLQTRGKNPFYDVILLISLVSIIRKQRPDIILTFYTKTNIYGGIAARICKIPYIVNITGLGSAVANGGILKNILMFLYAKAVSKAGIVFFQNHQNQMYFHSKHIKLLKEKLLPGSGVSIERFPILPYPQSNNYEFLFISRVLKEKGIYEFVEAARILKKEHPEYKFHIIGPYDEDYKQYLKSAETDGNIIVHGKVDNVGEFMINSHCTVFPSYYGEGMANVLLESASSGRPIITTNLPGCGETVEDGVSGYIVKPQDVNDLVEKITRFINLSYDEKKQMGLAGRYKMEREFNRKVVVDSYVNEINILLSKSRSSLSDN